MYTVPKPSAASGSRLNSETGPAISEPGESKELNIVPKSRLRTKESLFADVAFRSLVSLCAVALVGTVGLILFGLISQSHLSLSKFGFSFLIKTIWDPVEENFGALPFIYGTLVSSLVALIIAVPLSLGTALFLTEICPRRLLPVLSLLLHFLAPIPSLFYGL